MEKVSFNYKGRKITVNARNCIGVDKFFGLMFKRRKEADALLFSFSKQTKIRIHSFFVFFPFVAVWLGKDNKVVGLRKVKPFTFSVSSRKSYYKLIEIPINKKYSEIIKLLCS